MKLLTTKETAAFLAVPKKTLDQWRCRGDGPAFVKFNARCIRYKLETLEGWIAERVRTSTSDPGFTS